MGKFKNLMKNIPRKKQIMDAIENNETIQYFFGLTSKLNLIRVSDFFS